MLIVNKKENYRAAALMSDKIELRPYTRIIISYIIKIKFIKRFM